MNHDRFGITASRSEGKNFVKESGMAVMQINLY